MLTLLRKMHLPHLLTHRWGVALAVAATLLATPVAHAALTANGNGTVTDSTTGLVWDQCVRGRSTTTTACDTGTATIYTWANALAEVSTRNTANHLGFSDWRLPSKNELESIVKIDAQAPAIDTTVFPNTPITGHSWGEGGHWTSTTFAPGPASAWVVSFVYGTTDEDGKGIPYFVRLVRSGQPSASFDGLLPVVNGSCGSANTTTPLVATPPSGGALCTTGTAGSVTAGNTAYTWTCAGSNPSGTCSASRGYDVASGVVGANGSISAAQVVAYNATATVTATPASGFGVNTWGGTCGGAASGTGNVSYTTSAVTADCDVSVSFSGNDSTPDAFNFTAANGVALSTLQTSNTITVAGLTTGAAISITGGEYQIGSGSFVSTGGTVNNGNTVTVRHTSSGAHSTATTTTLTIGGVSANFVSTTVVAPSVNGSCGSAHSPSLVTSAPSTNLCAAGTASSVTAGTSAYTWSCAGSNSGTTANCSASRGYTVTASAGAGAANGSISPSTPQVVAHNATPAFTLTPNTGYAASATGCGGSLSGNTYTTAAVTADCAVSASFTGNDSTPDAFSFTAANGVALGTVQTSNSITVTGINTAANISIAGGEYSINSGAPTSTAGTVNNGDTIAVRHTSSGAHSTATTTTLTIGGVSANFVSTTLAAPPVNGSCGSAHTPTPLLTSAPSANLCGVGSTASSVTAGTSTYNWMCAGSNGGTTAPCSAGRGYTVTPSAGANGSLSPSTQQVVAYNATPTFTVTPASGYSTASVTGCAGSLNGSTYTTGGITADCAVSASFSLNTRYNGGAPTGSGSVEAVLSGGPTCGFASVGYQAASAVATPPAGMTFPHGVLAFTTNTCATGGSVSVTLNYPQALPANAKFYKYGPPAAGQASQWYEHPATISGNTVTYSVTDGGMGDSNAAPGVITDPAGAAVPGNAATNPIPTLGEWAMLLLAVLMGLMGWGVLAGGLRRREVTRNRVGF